MTLCCNTSLTLISLLCLFCTDKSPVSWASRESVTLTPAGIVNYLLSLSTMCLLWNVSGLISFLIAISQGVKPVVYAPQQVVEQLGYVLFTPIKPIRGCSLSEIK